MAAWMVREATELTARIASPPVQVEVDRQHGPRGARFPRKTRRPKHRSEYRLARGLNEVGVCRLQDENRRSIDTSTLVHQHPQDHATADAQSPHDDGVRGSRHRDEDGKGVW